VILLDTHALLWWALDPGKLSTTAATVTSRMEQDGGFASSISLWELGVKVRNGTLELPITVDELARRIERGGVVDLLPVDTTTWLRSLSLERALRDPADRVIVASALLAEVPILTKDRTLREVGGATCVW